MKRTFTDKQNQLVIISHLLSIANIQGWREAYKLTIKTLITANTVCKTFTLILANLLGLIQVQKTNPHYTHTEF